MKTLIYYEKRKILRRKSTIIACLLMLLSIIALSFVFLFLTKTITEPTARKYPAWRQFM